MPIPPPMTCAGLGLGVFVLYLLLPPLPILPCGSLDGAGLPIGRNRFCRLPIITGDCVASGDDPCPVGEENELLGVAERELLSDTVLEKEKKRGTINGTAC